MGVLIVGLAIFLGVHSIRLVGLRGVVARAMGEGMFAILYSILSAVGLALIVYGHILSHPSETVWTPPAWTRTLALFAIPVSLVLVVSAYVPSHIRAIVRHPMTLGILVWSGTHLLANGELANIVLFGSFAVWSLVTLIEAYVRGGEFENPGTWRADMTAVLVGLAFAAGLAWFHMQLFGVAVIGFASEAPPPGI
ncbi:hypothetical protein E5163_13840 [Marinicauda algicola]|uniref:NnrU domain-containing protein n=1 Tax=Marinicauda algicola TaxID=2029849 RepID=A0A4S2GYW9_9PROT|nr:NnrU family protein [Marinicauda algicola]TGY87982.1 hypothetical protein E5163_13840 [Marinicauda algicola]